MKQSTTLRNVVALCAMTLVLLLHAGVVNAQTAKAIWCAGNTTLYFTYDNETYAAGGNYEGQSITITSVYNVPTSSQTNSDIPWNSIRESVTNVIIANNFRDFEPEKLSYWFSGFKNITTINGLGNINTSNATSIGNIFAGCSSLTSLDGISNWDTSNVENIIYAFSGCKSLESLDLNSWDTSKVTSLEHTFYECSSLTSLDGISNWNTSSVTTMYNTFYGCSSLTSLDGISNWNTSSVTEMRATFNTCTSLTSLDGISNWNTSSVTDMWGTFNTCTSLTSLDGISNWNTSSVTSMQATFGYCTSLTSLAGISNWNTSSVTNMSYTFNNCTSLTSLDGISEWDTSNVTNMSSTFWNCTSLESLDKISNWNTSSVTSMQSTFSTCTSLESLDGISNWNTSSVTNMSYMFLSCSSLELVNMNNWDNWNTSNVTNMKSTFKQCTNLRGISFGENFTMKNASGSKSSEMFSECLKLRYIDFYNCSHDNMGNALNTVSLTSNTFKNVPKTTVIYLPKKNRVVTGVRNVVYSYNGDETDLRCPKYYSEDKVDIELPHAFITNKAEYTRTMSTKYGTVILPYEFKSNSNIQAYTLNDEYTKEMFFKDAATVPAHTPFAFNKLGNADFTMTDDTDNFGITVEATRSTNASEDTWTGSKGEPYTHTEILSGWTTKGYYVNETVPTTVEGFANTFYIAGDYFYKASDDLTIYPHRITFHGEWKINPTTGNGAKAINFVDNGATAIDAAEARMAEQNEIYDAQGRQHSKLTRGLNIIRMSDGTTRKVIRK